MLNGDAYEKYGSTGMFDFEKIEGKWEEKKIKRKSRKKKK